MKMLFNPIEVENNRSLDKETDYKFFSLMQRALLLGLKDAGVLSEMQHRHIKEILLHKYRADFRKIIGEENNID